jgi:hypothetical protein
MTCADMLQWLGGEFKSATAYGVFKFVGACAGFCSFVYSCWSFWVKDMDHVRVRCASDPASRPEALRITLRNGSMRPITIAGLELQWRTTWPRWSQPVNIQPVTNRPDRSVVATRTLEEIACGREGLAFAIGGEAAARQALSKAHRITVHYGPGKRSRSNTVRGWRR